MPLTLPSQAAAVAPPRRVLVCGLREVRKAVKAGRAKSVILAPDIEENEADGGLLVEHLQEILDR